MDAALSKLALQLRSSVSHDESYRDEAELTQTHQSIGGNPSYQVLLPMNMVDRCKLTALAGNLDTFLRLGGVEQVDSDAEDVESDVYRGPELFIDEKINLLKADAARRRIQDLKASGKFHRLEDPLHLIGEILELSKEARHSYRTQSGRYQTSDETDGSKSAEFQEFSKNMYSNAYAQLLRSQETLDYFDRLKERTRGLTDG